MRKTWITTSICAAWLLSSCCAVPMMLPLLHGGGGCMDHGKHEEHAGEATHECGKDCKTCAAHEPETTGGEESHADHEAHEHGPVDEAK